VGEAPSEIDAALHELLSQEGRPVPEELVSKWRQLSNSSEPLPLNDPEFVQAIERQARRMCPWQPGPILPKVVGLKPEACGAEILRLSRVAQFKDRALVLYSWQSKDNVSRKYNFDYYRFRDFDPTGHGPAGEGVWLEVRANEKT